MFSKIAMAARYILGLMFTVFGANGLMMAITGSGFIPMPPPAEPMITIMTGFMATGYLMTLVFICQFLGGIFLLSGFFINTAIVLLGPVIVNILCIHIFAERQGLPMAVFVVVLFVILVKSRWSDFHQLVRK